MGASLWVVRLSARRFDNGHACVHLIYMQVICCNKLYGSPMAEPGSSPHPELVRLQSLVFQRRLKMSAVLAKASVSRNTWWRMRKGEDFYMSTLTALEAAINQLTQEKENGETQVG